MPVGIITGSGTPALPGLAKPRAEDVTTAYGRTAVSSGRLGQVDVLHVSRHGDGHARLSNHVNFRANVSALAAAGATAVIGCTACGSVDPALEPGSLVVFDDLHYIANRLPDGALCTFFDEPGAEDRGHWILGEPYSDGLRKALVAGAREAGRTVRDGGCYGHVDGPRFNTRTEIRALAACGVTAVSQTGGPETVLCGELELPYALIGFVTDFANGVSPGEPTPVDELIRLMGESGGAFAATLAAALPRLGDAPPAPAGLVYRFGAK